MLRGKHGSFPVPEKLLKNFGQLAIAFVSDDDIRLSERFCFFRICLRHTAGQNNNRVRIVPFKAANSLTRLSV